MDRPPYRIAPPRDTLGVRHVRTALADLEFPAKTSEIRARAGSWRMPRTGAEFETLDAWLDGVPERTFRSPEAVADAIERAHPELRE